MGDVYYSYCAVLQITVARTLGHVSYSRVHHSVVLQLEVLHYFFRVCALLCKEEGWVLMC